VPPDVHALAERLRRDYERFSPAQQSLSRYLADNLADVPLLSAHEVARASHCSPATVVRFAQALGYSGYPEMQRTVRRAQRPGLPPRPGDLVGRQQRDVRQVVGQVARERLLCRAETVVVALQALGECVDVGRHGAWVRRRAAFPYRRRAASEIGSPTVETILTDSTWRGSTSPSMRWRPALPPGRILSLIHI
jgi:hypothetical protein